MDPQGLGLTANVEPGPHGSDVFTPLPLDVDRAGVRIRVQPTYLPQRSDPLQPMHVFAYAVLIEYRAASSAPKLQVIDRRWRIVDAHGTEEIVQGEGVVGQQPVLQPGERFEYASYCPMRTRWGTMEGELGVLLLGDQDEPGQRFAARVGRFYLVSEHVS